MKKLSAFLLLLFFSSSLIGQHDNEYSQFMFNGLVINPAYAGANNDLNITILERNQWVGFDGAPKTTSVSANSPLRNNKLNLGMSFTSDRFGITQKNSFNCIYAYRIKLFSGSLAFGLQGGLIMTANNWGDLQTTTAGDQVFIGRTKSVNPQTGFGFYYQSTKFYCGFSSPDLIKFGSAEKNDYRSVFFNAGYLLNTSGDFKFKPSVLVKYIHNSPVQVDFNLNSYYRQFGFGLSFRTNDALVFLLQYAINDQFSAGYSYDMTISRLRTYNSGSHEIMLRYDFGYKLNAKSPRYF